MAGDEANVNFLRERLAEVLPAPTSDTGQIDADAVAETVLHEERLNALLAERAKPLNLTARNEALDAEIEAERRRDYEAQQSYASEAGPSPDTVTFAAGTDDPTKRAVCALASEEGYSRTETQAIADQLAKARWLSPEQFRAELMREWGSAYAVNAALADRMMERLRGRSFYGQIEERESGGRFFSPELARMLVAWAKRPAAGVRMR